MMAAMTINDRADFECQCTAGNNRVPCTRLLLSASALQRITECLALRPLLSASALQRESYQ